MKGLSGVAKIVDMGRKANSAQGGINHRDHRGHRDMFQLL